MGHYGFSTLIALAIDSLSERISPRVLFPNTFLLTNWDNSIRFFTLLSSFLHGSFHFSFLNFLLEFLKNVGWLVGCSWKHSCRPIESILINISGSSMWWLPEVSPTLRSHPRCSPFVKSGWLWPQWLWWWWWWKGSCKSGGGELTLLPPPGLIVSSCESSGPIFSHFFWVVPEPVLKISTGTGSGISFVTVTLCCEIFFYNFQNTLKYFLLHWWHLLLCNTSLRSHSQSHCPWWGSGWR